MRPRRSLAAAALVLAALAGCETAPELEPAADPERAFAAREAQIAALEQWSTQGRLGVRAPNDAWSADVRWEQRGDRYYIHLSGPLGQGIMALDGAPDGVEVRTAEGEVLRAASPDQLVYQETGWRLPVAGLRHWILGLPAPQAPVDAMVLDAAGRLATLRQSGWDIRFESYDEYQDIALPTRISLESGDIGARMVMRAWTLGPPS